MLKLEMIPDIHNKEYEEDTTSNGGKAIEIFS
jgi:hypothetical protein